MGEERGSERMMEEEEEQGLNELERQWEWEVEVAEQRSWREIDRVGIVGIDEDREWENKR